MSRATRWQNRACRAGLFAVTLGGASTPACAHNATGDAGLTAGFMHPLTGPDHLLAMVAVGMVSVVLGRAAVWQVPAAFLAAMVVGATAGFLGLRVPYGELAMAASVTFVGSRTNDTKPNAMACCGVRRRWTVQLKSRPRARSRTAGVGGAYAVFVRFLNRQSVPERVRAICRRVPVGAALANPTASADRRRHRGGWGKLRCGGDVFLTCDDRAIGYFRHWLSNLSPNMTAN